MTEESHTRLEGIELRVFASLLFKRHANTPAGIETELTRKPQPDGAEITRALESLSASGHVEEFEPGRWRILASGYAKRWILLGDDPRRR